MKYDNRRLITGLACTNVNVDVTNKDMFYQSVPHQRVETSLIHRKVSGLGTARFNAFFPTNSSIGDGKGYQSLLKRMLVRALLHKPEMFGLKSDVINSQFISEFLQKYGITQGISQQTLMSFVSRQRHQTFLPHAVPRTYNITVKLDSVKFDYPTFNPELFYKK